jgi:hypothetical protein
VEEGVEVGGDDFVEAGAGGPLGESGTEWRSGREEGEEEGAVVVVGGDFAGASAVDETVREDGGEVERGKDVRRGVDLVDGSVDEGLAGSGRAFAIEG